MKITVTVEVDPQQWADEYGIDAGDTAEIRADLVSYLRDRLQTGNPIDVTSIR